MSGEAAITAIKVTAFIHPEVLQKLSNLVYQVKDEQIINSSLIFDFFNDDYK